MADEKTNGTSTLLTIVAIYVIISLIMREWNPLKWFSRKPYQDQSEYDKCIEANKAKPDGSECTNCIPDGSQMATFAGVILNGECIPNAAPPSTSSLKVTNPVGAEIYTQKSDGTGMQGTGQTVSTNTTLAWTNKVNSPYCPKNSQQCFLAKDFYQTQSGWLLETDITILT